jgi:hypothetical protein
MVPPASEDGATRQPPRMVPPVSSPTAGSPKQCHPSVRCAAKLVPPVSPEGPTGATRDPAHQLVPPVGSSPAGSVGKPETVPPASSTASCASPTQCHPSVRCAAKLVPPASPEGTDSSLGPVGRPVGATRQSEGANWCHPSVRTGPTGATRRFVSGRVSRQARNSATRQFGEPPTRCHQPPSWCHPSDCRKPTGSQLVPPVGLSPAGSARKPETVPRPSSSPARCKLGATPQSGGRKWRRCSWPLRPELLPFARSDRFQFVTQRRGLCSLVTLNEKLLA